MRSLYKADTAGTQLSVPYGEVFLTQMYSFAHIVQMSCCIDIITSHIVIVNIIHVYIII